MKLDRRKIEMLTSMSDEKMWGAIKLFASTCGIDLSRKRVKNGEIARYRNVLTSLTEGDIARINELSDVYKYGRRL